MKNAWKTTLSVALIAGLTGLVGCNKEEAKEDVKKVETATTQAVDKGKELVKEGAEKAKEVGEKIKEKTAPAIDAAVQKGKDLIHKPTTQPIDAAK